MNSVGRRANLAGMMNLARTGCVEKKAISPILSSVCLNVFLDSTVWQWPMAD